MSSSKSSERTESQVESTVFVTTTPPPAAVPDTTVPDPTPQTADFMAPSVVQPEGEQIPTPSTTMTTTQRPLNPMPTPSKEAFDAHARAGTPTVIILTPQHHWACWWQYLVMGSLVFMGLLILLCYHRHTLQENINLMRWGTEMWTRVRGQNPQGQLQRARCTSCGSRLHVDQLEQESAQALLADVSGTTMSTLLSGGRPSPTHLSSILLRPIIHHPHREHADSPSASRSRTPSPSRSRTPSPPTPAPPPMPLVGHPSGPPPSVHQATFRNPCSSAERCSRGSKNDSGYAHSMDGMTEVPLDDDVDTIDASRDGVRSKFNKSVKFATKP